MESAHASCHFSLALYLALLIAMLNLWDALLIVELLQNDLLMVELLQDALLFLLGDPENILCFRSCP